MSQSPHPFVSTVFASKSNAGLVTLRLPAPDTQLTPEAARSLAFDLLIHAERAESHEVLAEVLKRHVRMPEEAANLTLTQFALFCEKHTASRRKPGQ